MKSKITKILVVVYSLVHYFANKIYPTQKGSDANKNILVFFHEPGIGDIVTSLDIIQQLNKIFPKAENYTVYIGLERKSFNFLSSLNLREDYNFLPLDIDYTERDSFFKFRTNYQTLASINWDKVIIPRRIGPFLKLLFMGINVKGMYLTEFISNCQKRNFNSYLNLLLPNLEIIKTKDDEMIFKIYEKVFTEVCGQKILLHLPFIPKLGEITGIPSKKYCVISCGVSANHSNIYRRWPAERFASVINFIIKNFSMKVLLCGDSNDKKFTDQVISFLPKGHSEVINLVGKTNFVEWIELTRNAEFVFGNDSGYIHIASAVRTKPFVLSGYWNYGRFYPYQLDDLDGKEFFPVTIQANKPKCYLCNLLDMRDNKEAYCEKIFCDKLVANKKIYNCIDLISSKKVTETLFVWFGKLYKKC